MTNESNYKHKTFLVTHDDQISSDDVLSEMPLTMRCSVLRNTMVTATHN